jgi:protease-4
MKNLLQSIGRGFGWTAKLINKIALGLGWMILSLVIVSVIGVVVFAVILTDSDREIGSSVKNAVAVVELNGPIMTSKKFRKDLLTKRDDDNVEAIVVRIDSPGGGVGASEEIFRVIKESREVKPIVCSLGSMAASGGLYAAVGCSKIVTNKGTMTGSIGVIMTFPDAHKVMSTVGVGMNVIKSGNLKDSISPFRQMRDEDISYLQRLSDQMFEQFLSTVANSRNLDIEAVRKYADGRVISGEEAVELGLADEIGGIDRAAKLALELKGIDGEPNLQFPKPKSGLMKMLEDPPLSQIRVWLDLLSGPQLRYQLW